MRGVPREVDRDVVEGVAGGAEGHEGLRRDGDAVALHRAVRADEGRVDRAPGVGAAVGVVVGGPEGRPRDAGAEVAHPVAGRRRAGVVEAGDARGGEQHEVALLRRGAGRRPEAQRDPRRARAVGPGRRGRTGVGGGQADGGPGAVEDLIRKARPVPPAPERREGAELPAVPEAVLVHGRGPRDRRHAGGEREVDAEIGVGAERIGEAEEVHAVHPVDRVAVGEVGRGLRGPRGPHGVTGALYRIPLARTALVERLQLDAVPVDALGFEPAAGVGLAAPPRAVAHPDHGRGTGRVEGRREGVEEVLAEVAGDAAAVLRPGRGERPGVSRVRALTVVDLDARGVDEGVRVVGADAEAQVVRLPRDLEVGLDEGAVRHAGRGVEEALVP